MKRIHTTDRDQLDMSKQYHQDRNKTVLFKPVGLWYSINNEWFNWCVSEMPDWIRKYQFILKIDMTNILVISNPKELNEFCTSYSEPISEHARMIDWLKVSEKYKGIELLNYYKLKSSIPFSHVWLCGWDVSGGCVWNISTIQSFERKLINHEKIN